MDIFVLQRMIGAPRFAFRARLCSALGVLICAACSGASTNAPVTEPAKKSSAFEQAPAPADAGRADLTPQPSDSLSESSTDRAELPSFQNTYSELSTRSAIDFSPYTETPSWFSDIDPMSWYAAIEQKPLKRWSGLRRRLPRPPFPGYRVARVRAFELGWWEYANAMDRDCEFLTDKGTLCPRVVAPGKTLTPAQQERLLSIVRDPPRDRKIDEHRSRGRPSFRCGDITAAAFVFYDSKDIPRGVVTLTLGCLSWRFEPDVPNTLYSSGGLFEEERAVVQGLCDELSLKGCQSTPAEGPKRQTSTVRARRLLPLVLKDPQGIDPSKPLSETTSAERRTLCVWAWRGLQTAALALKSLQRTMEPNDEIAEQGGSGAMRVLSFEECINRFPKDCLDPVAKRLDFLRETASKLAEGRVMLPSDCSFGLKTVPQTQTHKERLIELR